MLCSVLEDAVLGSKYRQCQELLLNTETISVHARSTALIILSPSLFLSPPSSFWHLRPARVELDTACQLSLV